MKKLTYILFYLLTITSCAIPKENKLNFNSAEISKIEVYQGFPGIELQMKDGFTEDFLKDLNGSTKIGSTKYMRPYHFLIFYTNGKIDTILTNGSIHSYNGWHESKENLIEKYADPIQGQLLTAEKLRAYMDEKSYHEAIKLFSRERQTSIRKIQADDTNFQHWCAAWTFDQAKFDRYVSIIKSGKAPFIFEGNQWKIDEK